MYKKALSFVSITLSVLFVFSFFGLCFYAFAETEPTFENGDIIEFGTYPQNILDEEADADLILGLEKLVPEDVSMWETSTYIENEVYMHYKDVVYDTVKYRVINLDAFDTNGYVINTHYWFKYEPIKWKVLDAECGIILSDNIIDSKPLHFVSYYDSKYNVFYGDTDKTFYSNNYSQSSLRKWLNDEFYNTAFTLEEQAFITKHTCDNSAYGGFRINDSEPLVTKDKVFILSHSEVMNSDWGFSESTNDSDSRIACGTEYAISQDLDWSYGGKSPWWLRTPAGDSGKSCIVAPNGILFPSNYEAWGFGYGGTKGSSSYDCGVRPALQLSKTPTGENTKCIRYIEYGNYPQSRLDEREDANLISALNSLVPQDNKLWDSYGYYSGTDEDFDGQMESKDYMRYKDVVYEGNKYRAVVFDTYRPAHTDNESTETSFSYQNNNIGGNKNKYTINTVYWFKFEPIEWRVLDPLTGLAMCTSAIDSQAYNNYILWFDVNGDGDWDEDDLNYGDKDQTYYANDYENSSIRKWLNEDFYNTAFTYEQRCNIKSTEISEFSLTDKVFLLSLDEVNSSEYGFNTGNTVIDKISHFMKSSDYARCQGCKMYNFSNDQASDYYGNCPWWLRSPNCDTEATRAYDEYGRYSDYVVSQTYLGVVPAICLSNIESDTSISTISAPNMFAVTFDLNGHGAALETQMIEEGQKIICPAPNPAEKGFIFEGWFTESECANEWDFNNALVDSITLYAKWIECTHESSTSQPTCTSGADCSLCHAHLPSKGHTIGNPITENETNPSCINDGSYDKVVYCSVCGEELSRNTISVPRTGHKDENNDGVCDVCGNKDEEINDISDLEQAKNAVINTGSDIKVEYRTTVTVIATSNLPDGYKLAVYEGKTKLSVGTNKEVNVKLGKITKDRAVTVKVIGKDGQPLEDADEKTLTIKVTDTSFFAKIIAIIKDLFGLIKPVVIKP